MLTRLNNIDIFVNCSRHPCLSRNNCNNAHEALRIDRLVDCYHH